MKISIGDITDRYSICKLKSERLSLDLSDEINQLEEELINYKGISSYVGKLYEVNGLIWDLESDIRKGNEKILGLEEIGRRALKIRDYNNVRVSIKNEINSKYNEGFIEVKMNHGSESEKSVIISLTTVPERLENEKLDGLRLVLSSLCEQIDNDYEVHLNIPEVSMVTKKEYKIPLWINEYKLKYPHLKIFRPEDIGPPTKFVPTLLRLKNPETILLVVDDDLVYHKEMVMEHRKYQNEFIDSVIGYDGRGCDVPLYNNDIRDSWILCVTEPRKTHSLQHYKSVSYKKKLFGKTFFNDYLGTTFSDDVLISLYFKNEDIPMYVVPYEKENHLFQTRELWDEYQGVTTFPILRYASSVENTGCNHPKMLDLQPKFFTPVIKNLKNTESIKTFTTDKVNHGYMEIYSPLFTNMKVVDKVLEIGVYQGESLDMLSHFFNDAIIHGIDISDCSNLNSEKIKTHQHNQEIIGDLNEFIKNVGGDFDLIIDDGGHTMKQQQLSFGVLFKHLKKGGVYIIEDLHTSLWSSHISSDDVITTLEMLNQFNETGKLLSNHISDKDKKYIEESIDSIKIWTRTPDYNESVTSIIIKK
jgi:hypothetical protein